MKIMTLHAHHLQSIRSVQSTVHADAAHTALHSVRSRERGNDQFSMFNSPLFPALKLT